MHEKLIFRKINKDEIPILYDIIKERIQWMGDNDIKQWEVVDYESLFPLSYYEKKYEKGEIFVLVKASNNELLCGGVLLEHDDLWDDDEPSIYLHNFASKLGYPGIGKIYMKYTEEYAKSIGKIFLRLDSINSNKKLTKYYEDQGFKPVGKCHFSTYYGVLRQKRI